MTEKPLTVRLREYAGEVLHIRHDDPPHSNEYECAVAALEAADRLDRITEVRHLVHTALGIIHGEVVGGEREVAAMLDSALELLDG